MIYGFWAVQLYLKTVGYLIFFSFDWSRFKGFVGCLTPLDSCRVLNTFRSSVLFWLCDRYLTVQILASCFSRKCVQKSSGDGDIFELKTSEESYFWVSMASIYQSINGTKHTWYQNQPRITQLRVKDEAHLNHVQQEG